MLSNVIPPNVEMLIGCESVKQIEGRGAGVVAVAVEVVVEVVDDDVVVVTEDVSIA